MGDKDITEKLLEDYNDVFADIVNVLLFGGQRKVQEGELQNARDKSQYKDTKGKIREQERDVSKYWKKGNIRIALLGVENQMEQDYNMPLRVIGYDGAAYRSQLVRGEGKKYPVITMVLYFGEKHWSAPRTLYDSMDIPDELKPYVSDYRINIFEIAYLTEEQVKLFQSDFRIVADYFVQMRKNHDYQPEAKIIRHVDEVLKLMSVLTRDDRYEVYQNETVKGGATMCEVLDRIEARGEARGEAKVIRNMYKKGIPLEDIAEMAEKSVDEVKAILERKNLEEV